MTVLDLSDHSQQQQKQQQQPRRTRSIKRHFSQKKEFVIDFATTATSTTYLQEQRI